VKRKCSEKQKIFVFQIYETGKEEKYL
jgi:hypothetical protein